MLEFNTPAPGWEIVYTAILTAASVVIAYFLGRWSERRRERWQRFEVYAGKVSQITHALFKAAVENRLPYDAAKAAFDELWWSNIDIVDPRDRDVLPWITDVLADAFTEISRLFQTGGTELEWGQAQLRAQRARSALSSYRARGKRRKTFLKELSIYEALGTIEPYDSKRSK